MDFESWASVAIDPSAVATADCFHHTGGGCARLKIPLVRGSRKCLGAPRAH